MPSLRTIRLTCGMGKEKPLISSHTLKAVLVHQLSTLEIHSVIFLPKVVVTIGIQTLMGRILSADQGGHYHEDN